MIRLLVPVDGSSPALRAVAHAIRLCKCREVTPEILLVNVREPMDAWEVRRFLNEAEIEGIQKGEGEEDLREAVALLDSSGIPYRPRILIGPIAQTIADFAQQEGCDSIVMGSHGRGELANLFLGSVATKVVHLSPIPVTLVK